MNTKNTKTLWFVRGHFAGKESRFYRAFPSEWDARKDMAEIEDVGVSLYRAEVELSLIDEVAGYL